MLEFYFEVPAKLRQYRSGPCGPYLDGFTEDLHHEQYAALTVQAYVRAIHHLGLWMLLRKVAVGDLEESSLGAFKEHVPCQCLGHEYLGATSDIVSAPRRFLRYLRKAGVAAPRVAADPNYGFDTLAEFRQWMQDHRGATSATLKVYSRVITDFLRTLGENTGGYDASAVRRFVLDRAKRSGRDKAKQVMTAVRAFLRFLVACKGCDPALVDAVPIIPKRKLVELPRYLGAEQVERVIAACDPSSPVGARNRAVILLLARMGLRAGEVVKLRLCDIDWPDATVKLHGKGRQEARLPLPQEVGDSILHYLETARPRGSDEHVFLRAMAPPQPLTPGAISSIVRFTIDRVGIEAPHRGAHVLRHSAATAMVRAGASLESIAAVLRHRSIETTTLYAKVDLVMLRQLAQPWPGEEAPC